MKKPQVQLALNKRQLDIISSVVMEMSWEETQKLGLTSKAQTKYMNENYDSLENMLGSIQDALILNEKLDNARNSLKKPICKKKK